MVCICKQESSVSLSDFLLFSGYSIKSKGGYIARALITDDLLSSYNKFYKLLFGLHELLTIQTQYTTAYIGTEKLANYSRFCVLASTFYLTEEEHENVLLLSFLVFVMKLLTHCGTVESSQAFSTSRRWSFVGPDSDWKALSHTVRHALEILCLRWQHL